MINVDLNYAHKTATAGYRYLTVRTGVMRPQPPLCQCGITRSRQINVAPVSVLGLVRGGKHDATQVPARLRGL